MNVLKKKMNKKGFTLAELLIVVAIIAILVAVSIPIFTSKLEQAREATDIANMRAAKGMAATAVLTKDYKGADAENWTNTDNKYVAYYDIEEGKMVKTAPTVKYGKGTKIDGKTVFKDYTSTSDYTKSVIKVEINDADETVTISWDPAATTET